MTTEGMTKVGTTREGRRRREHSDKQVAWDHGHGLLNVNGASNFTGKKLDTGMQLH